MRGKGVGREIGRREEMKRGKWVVARVGKERGAGIEIY